MDIICPRCRQGRCRIVKLSPNLDNWHVCDFCGVIGDTIQLAAVILETDLGIAADKFLSPTETEAYLRYRHNRDKYSQYQRKLNEILKNYTSTVAVDTLLTSLGWSELCDAKVWLPTLAPCVTVISPSRLWVEPKKREQKPTHGALLFEIAPSLVSGILLCKPEREKSTTSFSVNSYSPKYTVKSASGHKLCFREAGLFGLSYTLHSRIVYAIDNPFTAVKIQTKNLLAGLSPLPIVAWYDGAAEEENENKKSRALTTRYGWQWLNTQQVIIISEKLTPAALAAAIATNGKIALVSPRKLLAPTRKNKFIDMQRRLNNLEKVAVPWHIQLWRWETNLGLSPAVSGTSQQISRITSMLEGVKIHGITEEEFFSALSPATIKKVKKAQEKPPVVKTRIVLVKDREFIETATGWLLAADKKAKQRKLTNCPLVCSSPFRIFRIYNDQENIWYEGEIRINGTWYPFQASQNQIEKETKDWITQIHKKYQQPEPIITPCGVSLVDISRAFYTPELIALNQSDEPENFDCLLEVTNRTEKFTK